MLKKRELKLFITERYLVKDEKKTLFNFSSTSNVHDDVMKHQQSFLTSFQEAMDRSILYPNALSRVLRLFCMLLRSELTTVRNDDLLLGGTGLRADSSHSLDNFNT